MLTDPNRHKAGLTLDGQTAPHLSTSRLQRLHRASTFAFCLALRKRLAIAGSVWRSHLRVLAPERAIVLPVRCLANVRNSFSKFAFMTWLRRLFGRSLVLGLLWGGL